MRLKTWLACAAAALLPPLAAAQDGWPTRPVRLLVAFPAGAPGDVIARLVQPALQQALGQPVLVDNKPGASGNIGAGEVVRATDGHTVLVGPDTIFTVNPHVYRKLPFDPARDLVPVTQLASFSQMLVCHPGTGWRGLPALLDASRGKALSYASGGPGVPGHMAMEMLLAATQTQMQHVAYRGPGPAMQDVLGGSVPCGFLASPVVGPLVQDGKLLALAVSGSKRLVSHGSVPTVAEGGVKDYDATFTEMLAMPRGTPPAVLQKLQREVARALAAPEVRSRLAVLDLEPLANTPEEAARSIAAEHARWGTVAQRIRLQLD
ncbi:MAG TPA: tripartite tricarboxylate transporter substrate-binding protein [Ramlibacter sp.]|nr:tripartite tricarboxylate transporter substrate-binding protein [Ramlibacter sp.]